MPEPDVVGGEATSVHLESRIVVGRRHPIGTWRYRLEVPTTPGAVALRHLHFRARSWPRSAIFTRTFAFFTPRSRSWSATDLSAPPPPAAALAIESPFSCSRPNGLRAYVTWSGPFAMTTSPRKPSPVQYPPADPHRNVAHVDVATAPA
jgi:hypothetical protein